MEDNAWVIGAVLVAAIVGLVLYVRSRVKKNNRSGGGGSGSGGFDNNVH